MIDANAEAPLLQNCPNCGYCLRGLDLQQLCPECGRQFDRAWRVFGGVARWRTFGFWGWAKALSLQALTLFLMWHGLLRACVEQGIISVHGLLTVWWACIWVAYIRHLLARPSEFVAVGPKGITVGHLKSGQLSRYAWANVQGVSNDLEGFVLKVNGGELKFDAWHGNSAEAERCTECIEEYLDDFSQPENPWQ